MIFLPVDILNYKFQGNAFGFIRGTVESLRGSAKSGCWLIGFCWLFSLHPGLLLLSPSGAFSRKPPWTETNLFGKTFTVFSDSMIAAGDYEDG